MTTENRKRISRESASRRRAAGAPQWQKINRDARNAYVRKWSKENRERILETRQRREFGNIPPRPAFCDACGGKPTGKYAKLHLDHEHLTGEFRGWLCHHCNTALGLLQDSSDRCIALARYLREKQL